MKSNGLLPPIEHEQFQMVLIRTCCRVIELDYRRNPDLYSTYPPLRILGLAEEMRSHLGFPGLFGTLIYIAKAVQAGVKMRDIPLTAPNKVWRAISKRTPSARPRRLPPY
jgi:hypothetical protein